MKEIYRCLNDYEHQIQTNNNSEKEPREILRLNILHSNNLIFSMRKLIRKNKFANQHDEIKFFKIIKPQICGRLKFYKLRLEYLIEMPFVSISNQEKYIKNKVKLLEQKKEKYPTFYCYLKRGDHIYDDKYFIRNTNQSELFINSDIADYDPEFSTSHDQLAGEVEFYNLTIKFFKEELYRIQNNQLDFGGSQDHRKDKQAFSWSASKTDLVELIYALKVSGAINGGDAQIKELTSTFGDLFNVDLGNYYKTFMDIKNRTKEPAKFLNKLAINITQKIELEDAL